MSAHNINDYNPFSNNCTTAVLNALLSANVAVQQTLDAYSADTPAILTPNALLNIVTAIPGVTIYPILQSGADSRNAQSVQPYHASGSAILEVRCRELDIESIC